IGMCGPLALALPVPPGAGRGRLVPSRLAYNLGRATTYALLGAAVGFLGHGLRLAGLQRALSLLAAAVVAAHLIGRLGWGRRLLARWRRGSHRAGWGAVVAAWSRRLQGALGPRL